jgi:diguanylate cyclase (GGDEF)-like protein
MLKGVSGTTEGIKMDSGHSRGSEVDRLHFVIETQRLINATTLDTEGVMQVVTDRAQAATNADGGVVELAEGDEMVYRAVSGNAAGSLGVRLSMADSLSGLCVRQGVPLLCEDAETDPRVDREACRRVGVRSMIVVPLIHRGSAVGVLKVMSSRTGHFGGSDKEILELMAGFIAASLSNSFTFELEAHRALHDPLTGLPNRTLLLDRLEHQVSETRRYGGTFGLFFMDLDGFKEVNDRLGHDVGDAVLRAVARELLPTLRDSDTLARLGGDEFVLLCDHGVPLSEEHIRKRIDLAVSAVVEELKLDRSRFGASVGVVWSTGGSTTPAELLKEADAAMYREKQSRHGHNRGRVGQV